MNPAVDLRRHLAVTQLLLRDELHARAVPKSDADSIVMTGDHDALMHLVDPDDAQAGLSFLVGEISGLIEALGHPSHIAELIERERREFRLGLREVVDEAAGEAMANADYVAEALVDLELIAAADQSHDLNFAYGRLAALAKAPRLAWSKGG